MEFKFFWIDDKHLLVNGEKMLPEQAYKKYPEHAAEIEEFVNIKIPDNELFFEPVSRKKRPNNLSKVDSFDTNKVDDFVKKYFSISNKNIDQENRKLQSFKEIYTLLLNELEYDEDYAKAQKKLDKEKNLTALEIKNNDIERTKKDKKGVCTTFAMRINDELDKLSIPNCQVTLLKNGIQHAVNLYMINNNLYIADITQDIVYGHMLKSDKIPPLSYSIKPKEYLQGATNALCYTIDKPNVLINNVVCFQAEQVINSFEKQKTKIKNQDLQQ